MALRAEWGVAEDEVLAVTVGRLAPVKNHRSLLEAFAAISFKIPKLRLALVGTGHLERGLRAQTDRLGLTGRVLFLGYRSDIPDCLNASDLFVSASVSEGLPVSLLEAWAAGLPVVATAVGGIPEAMGNPAAGILVESGDSASLAAALAALSTDVQRRVRLGDLARKRSRSFSLEACVSRYCEVYNTLLAPPGDPKINPSP